MLSNDSKPVSRAACRLLPAVIGASLCIVAGMAGLLALSSCATDPVSLQHHDQTFQYLTNQLGAIRQGAVYLPPPANGIVEALLAVAAAGLAAWNTHLHGKVKTLANGKTARKA